jgi:polysaccharide export outer membrane protein
MDQPMDYRVLKSFLANSSCALFALLSAACSSSGGVMPAENCPVPEVYTDEYKIGVGDTLNIVVWRNDELSASVPVRPDGRISTPLIDDMQAAGKTPTLLGQDMEQVLSEYLRTPEVSVIVVGQGAANQIQVVGEVANAQALSYRDGLRMLDVIVSVGGMTDFAAGNRAKLVRKVEAGQIECRVRLADLMSGDMRQNISVYPGDVIVVPETRF